MRLENFLFLRPAWLLALIPILVLWWLFRKKSSRPQGWERVCDPRLLPHVTEMVSSGSQRTRQALLLGAILSVLALAGPAWEEGDSGLGRDQSALVILLDLSRSMAVQDVSGSRLKRAVKTLKDLLATGGYGQTALVAFAGEAFPVCPLSSDASVVALNLEAMTTDLMPVPGTRTDLALESGMNFFNQAGIAAGNLLLVTDDASGEQLDKQLTRLKKAGHRLAVWGAGTSLGGPVPTPNGYLKDRSGNIVVPQLNEALLRKVAQKGGGFYASLADPTEAVSRTVNFSRGRLHDFKPSADMQGARGDWRELGPYLLLLALVPVAAQCRRGLFVLLFFLVLPAPPVSALDVPGFLKTSDQKAMELFASGHYQTAAQTFEDPNWKAAAHYRNGDWLKAAALWEKMSTADASYNLGNALAQLGEFDAALRAYEQALQINPTHVDACYNLQALERFVQSKKSRTSQSSHSISSGGSSVNHSREQADSAVSAMVKETPLQTSSNARDGKSGQSVPGDFMDHEQTSSSDSEGSPSPDSMPISSYEEWADKEATGLSSDGSVALNWGQALDKVPDDPTGLLRRKFKREQQSAPAAGESAW